MKKILHIIRKEFIQVRRDPKLFPILLLAPILQLLLLGYAVNLDTKDIPSVVCDLDGTPASREFISRFFHSGYFSLKERVTAAEDIGRFLDNGRASIAFVVPRGFGNHLAAGRTASVQVLLDGTESQSATVGAGYVSLITSRYAQEKAGRILEGLKAAGLKPVQVDPEIRVWYNPELKSRNFMVPGVLGLILLVMTMMLTSMAVVREKEMGTMEQLSVTPIRPLELIAGKLLPFLIIGILDVLLVTGVSVWLFRVPIRGSVWLLLGLSLIFMMSTLGLGLFTSTISHNQQQAMLMTVLFMMPMIFFSGFVFPIANMPKVIQWVTYLMPLRYYCVIIRGIYLKGVGLAELWGQALALLVFGLTILALSVLRFSKKVG
jgi:ABC-2 type transport system permease protein